jgi:hypothetical protein
MELLEHQSQKEQTPISSSKLVERMKRLPRNVVSLFSGSGSTKSNQINRLLSNLWNYLSGYLVMISSSMTHCAMIIGSNASPSLERENYLDKSLSC